MLVGKLEIKYTTPGLELPSKIHVKFHVNKHGFSNMATAWLAVVLQAN